MVGCSSALSGILHLDLFIVVVNEFVVRLHLLGRYCRCYWETQIYLFEGNIFSSADQCSGDLYEMTAGPDWSLLCLVNIVVIAILY